MRWRPLTGVALAAAFAMPAASAQSSSQTLFGFSGSGKPVSMTQIPGQLTGDLTVAFHGDPSSGCAAQGLCGYSGTVTLSPGFGAEMVLGRFRKRGQATYQVALSLAGDLTEEGTTAQVQRSGGGLCGDATSQFVTLSATITRGVVTLPLLVPGGTLLSTRCAGPLEGDLSSASPAIRLPVTQLLRGRRIVDLSGTRSFAAGGFAGTVTSTLRLNLGRPTTHSPNVNVFRGIKTRPERQVVENFAVTKAGGKLGLSIGSDPGSCQFLDSCGLHGSVTGTIAPQAPVASLYVIGPASRPYADFLAALGIGRKGNPRGLLVAGTIAWNAGGTVTSNLSQGVPCSSQAPLGGGAVALTIRGRRLFGDYLDLDPPRTRCPGPMLAQRPSLAAGSVSLRGIGAQGVTLHLSGRGPLSDDGYSISQQTSLTLRLRRTGLRRHILREPAF